MNGAVRMEREGRVLVVTIDRPHARNAVDMSVAEGLERAVEHLDEDPELRAGVLTGAGGYFCPGMDLKAFSRGERPFTARGGFAGIVQRPPKKVLVAAIEGFALAGGLEIALCCDVIVAARDAKLGIPEVGVGLVAAAGALLRLPERVSFGSAMEMAVTGAPISAERAESIGLVNLTTEPGEALPVSIGLAKSIASKAPLAVTASKRILIDGRGWSEDEKWERQEEIVGPIFDSRDAREGATAFAEKRDPVWRGK